MRAALLLSLCLFSVPAFAQTPLGVTQFAEPPELNGAPATTYTRHLLWNSTLSCFQRPVGAVWRCLTTREEVAADNAAQDAAIATAQGAATSAQTTANAAQSSASGSATAVSALTSRVSSAEAAIVTLQAVPRLACTTFAVAAGVTVPLTGISTATNVTLAGVPVGTVCDTGAPSRMPLGARPDPVVTTAGTVNMAFVSNAGLLSSVIAIPSGTYRVCCVL